MSTQCDDKFSSLPWKYSESLDEMEKKLFYTPICDTIFVSNHLDAYRHVSVSHTNDLVRFC